MNTMKICSGCQKPLEASAPDGLCPECLLKAGLGTGVDLGPDSQAESGRTSFVAPSLEEVARLFPQLEVLGFIGQGGMGAVYKARQKALDRVVALKILPPGIGKDPAFAERFTREAKALAKLNHTGIVTLYEFGQADGLFFFLMEFVDGMNLRHLLEVERISAREALAIVPQICDALQYAHDQGIVHRDIKPENILLDRQGRVKVADFGLAKLVGTEALTPALSHPMHPMGEGGVSAPVEGTPPPAALTDAGKVMGTPQYMAPEQREHPTEVDHRADIYSLGVVFYQMLTGELPGKPIEPPSRKVHIDVRLDEVVLRALEKEPQRRYQQASQVKKEVETISMDIGKSEARSQKPEFPPNIAKPAREWPLPLVGLRNGQRVIHWPGLLLFAALIVATAGLLSLIFYWLLPAKGYAPHPRGLVIGLLVGFFLMAFKLQQAWNTPIERLSRLDAPERSHGVWSWIGLVAGMVLLVSIMLIAAFGLTPDSTGVKTVEIVGQEAQAAHRARLAADEGLKARSGSVVERVVVGADQATLEGQGRTGFSLVLSLGDTTNRWECRFPNDTRFTAMFKRATQQGFSWMVSNRAGKALFATAVPQFEGEDLKRGVIVFREGTLAPEPDGSFVIAWLELGNGGLIPMRVRLAQAPPSSPREQAAQGRQTEPSGKVSVAAETVPDVDGHSASQAARLKLQQAQVEFARIRELYDTKLASQSQYEAARLARDLAEAEFTGDTMAVSRAKLQFAQEEFLRAEGLFKDRMISQADLEKARLAKDLAEARLSDDAAAIARVQVQIARQELLRAEGLFKDRMMSQTELNKAKDALDAAQAELSVTGTQVQDR